MIGCPGGECMLDGERTCRWRLSCAHRTDEILERVAEVERAQRVAEELGPCDRCGLEVVRYKGNGALAHVVPVAPVESRLARAATAAGHRPVVRLRVSA